MPGPVIILGIISLTCGNPVRIVRVMDGLLSQDQAQTLFQPYLGLLVDCLETGWAVWETIRSGPSGQKLGKRTRASVVWDRATARAEEVFEPIGDVSLRRHHGLLILDFDAAMVRFKKLDARLRTRGIPTAQQQLFAEQAQISNGEQLRLWPAAPMVIAGYVLDELESAVERMVLVLQRNSETIWEIDLPPTQRQPIAVQPTGDLPKPAAPRSLRRPPLEDKEAQ